jgi:archaellum component FlaF (FlaF/FlaG flagellin family)
MDKKVFFCLLIALIFFGLLYYFAVKYSPKVDTVSNEELKHQIELLEGKINDLSSKRDSIKSSIDTSNVKIIEIHEEYNKVRTNIIYQPVDSDYVQFSKYCSDNRGLLDISNASTTKDN